jgi:hypothetical protein
MKRIFIYPWMLLTALALTLSACNKNNETPPEPDPDEPQELPITVDVTTALRFGSKAIETFSVSVGGTTAWEVQNEASWVVAEKQPDNTLRLTATPSRSPFDRSATLTVAATNTAQGTASFVVTQAHGTPQAITRMLVNGIAVRHVSENGRWAAGQRGEQVVVADIDLLLSDENYAGVIVATPSPGGVHSIDNNGKPYVYGCSADGSIYTDDEQQPARDDAATGEWYPSHHVPYIMRNNRRIDLNYPSAYETAAFTSPAGVTSHAYMGCIADKMSADGKYIYGRLMNVNMGWFAAKWTRIGTTNDYEFRLLGQEGDPPLKSSLNVWNWVPSEGNPSYYVLEPQTFLCAQNISGLSMYGKYACGHYGGTLSGGGQLFRYDMENEKLELLEGANGLAVHVTDDGSLFDSSNRVHVKGNSTPISLVDWLTQLYGEDVASGGGGRGIGGVSAGYTTTILYNPDISQPTASHIITVVP